MTDRDFNSTSDILGKIRGHKHTRKVTRSPVQTQDMYRIFIWVFGIILIFLILYLTSLYSYLLFHSLAEILSIVLAWSIFLAAWNSRHIMANQYLLFMGIAYLFIGTVDTIHMLSYKGMGIFEGYGANLPTQLWVGARYIEGLSFLIAPIFITRKVKINLVFFFYSIVFALLIISVFYWHIFPDCYVEDSGLTTFKKTSEYVICLILILSGIVLYRRQKHFEKGLFRTLMASIIVTVMAELAFTQYISVYGWYNLVGHLLKIVSIYLIYKVVIQAGLLSPYSKLFMDLKRSRDDFEMQTYKLEARVKELNCLYGISKLREKQDVSLHQTLQDVVELIPPSWQYSDIACSRIILDDVDYKTKNFKETIWKQASVIFVNNKSVGSIEVFYLEERPESYEGPFLKDERTLINAIGERLGNIVQHERSREALKWELSINSALSELYKPLVSPQSSIQVISDSILSKALEITGSDNGFVSSIDPATGDNVVHTFTDMLKGECKVSEEKRTISFPIGKDGQYPSLWGHALNKQEAFFTNSPKSHESSKGLPEGHIPLTRFLSFPVNLGTELVGQIGLANKAEDYTDRDLLGISRLAEYFALAIQRKRVEDSLKEAHDELEKRVHERTAQLLATNIQLQKEIEEHKLAEESLMKSETERKKLSARLFEAYEEENRRIGRELHDGLAQTLSAIRIWGENALMQMNMGDSPETLSKTLNSLIRLAQEAIEEVRRIVRNMRPSILDDLGIITTISWLCKEFESVYSEIKIEREIDIDEDEVPDSLKIVIFRILQEALNNIAKHSRANHAIVCLENIRRKIELTIEDNGKGFDITNELLESKTDKGIGLANMRRRSELSGGLFLIESIKGKGSTIRVTWSHEELKKLSA